MQPPRKKFKPNLSTPGTPASTSKSPSGHSRYSSGEDLKSVSTSGSHSKSTISHTLVKGPPFDKKDNSDCEKNKRGKDLSVNIRITLKEAYSGTTKKVRLRRKVVCPMCKGVIKKEKKFIDCRRCKGKGKAVRLKSIGPNQTKRLEIRCTMCRATGKLNVNKCFNCLDRGVVSSKNSLKIKINKGWPDGRSVLIPREGYSAPGILPGDVKINVFTDKYHRFSVRGKDLIVYREIQLWQALTGVSLYICHLDSRILKLQSAPGVIIAPGSVYKIRGEGMPKLNPDLPNGDLFVIFGILYPEKRDISTERQNLLTSLLKEVTHNTLPLDHVDPSEVSNHYVLEPVEFESCNKKDVFKLLKI